ncbi:MAG: 4'-phosphopantetheinyl transferase superfamily protein [Oscillospiraceae bacterium]
MNLSSDCINILFFSINKSNINYLFKNKEYLQSIENFKSFFSLIHNSIELNFHPNFISNFFKNVDLTTFLKTKRDESVIAYIFLFNEYYKINNCLPKILILKNGKPIFIKNKIPDDFKFSISHSSIKSKNESFIMLVFCQNNMIENVGADIQTHTDSSVPINKIVSRISTENEKEYLKNINHTFSLKQTNIFCYNLWALKESFVKTQGQGLAFSKNISFNCNEIQKEIPFTLTESYIFNFINFIKNTQIDCCKNVESNFSKMNFKSFLIKHNNLNFSSAVTLSLFNNFPALN